MNSYNQLYKKKETYYQNDRKDVIPFVPQDIKRTLEFGCGQGNFSESLKQIFGVETWAVEMDEQSVSNAQNKIDKVIHADACEAMSQIPDHYFDCVFFLDILEHLINPYKLLEKVKQKLSSNGKLIASIPNIRYWPVFRKYAWSGDWEYEEEGIMDINHLRFFTRSSIIRMFMSLGYQIDKCIGVRKTRRRSFRRFNLLTFGKLLDCAYPQYIVIAHI
jgi:SAM-dependent methyltransferase